MRERERQTATKPRYYIRGIEITTHSGLGRTGGGGGLGSDFEHHHHVVHMGLGRARWHGTQGLPPPFRRPLCPSSRVGFAPISTKSGESRASGWILRSGPSELVDQGQHIEVSAGVVAIVGAASRAGREAPTGPAFGPPRAPPEGDCGRASDCGSAVSSSARTPTGFVPRAGGRGGGRGETVRGV